MVPPPPPPPAPPPGPIDSQKPGGLPQVTPDRSALLSQIHHGAKLKKATTNDRSAPIIDGNKSAGGAKDRTGNSGTSNQGNGPAAQLGGIFAQGMPKLRPTNKSILDGGDYKSPLTPHLGWAGRISQNSDFKKRACVSQPGTPATQRQKPYGQANGTVPSQDPLNVVKSIPSKINPVSLKPSRNTGNVSSINSVSSGSTSVSNVVSGANAKLNLHQISYLHKADSSKWGGSDPNLTSANMVKLKTSKPPPPPKSDQVLSGTNSSVLKSWPPGRSKSFDEDIVENDIAKTEKPSFLHNAPSLPKNTSEPSKLNTLQNHVVQPSSAPLAPHNNQNTSRDTKSSLKPAGAPPPLPSRPPMQSSPKAKHLRQASPGMRSSPVAHPSGAPPPPPPPRVFPQMNSSETKSLPPSSLGTENTCPIPTAAEARSLPPTSGTKSLPPVPPALGTKSLPPVPPASGTKPLPSVPGTRTLPPVPSAPGTKSLSHAPPVSETKNSASGAKPLPSVPKQPPLRQVQKSPYQSSENNSNETTSFESRFQNKFRDASELPDPCKIEMKKKMYPSTAAKQRASNSCDRSRLPPPVAPPPPPPPPNHV